MSPARVNTVDAFWAKVSKMEDGCWLWTGAIHPKGYGCFSNKRKTTRAHRFAYQQLVGEIPTGLHLDHLCRVRNCVNPAHLDPVTSRENTMRGLSPIVSGFRNTLKTHCPRGHTYDEKNTYRAPNGGRVCRKCWADKAREKRHARKR